MKVAFVHGTGTLTRLDMAGWGLACPFPASDLASITSLVELDLSLNSNITVRLAVLL